MTETVSFTFHFKWIVWTLGLAFALALAIPAKREALVEKLRSWEPAADRHFSKWLAGICFLWFALAAVAKWLQLRSLGLNAQDFWLFVDILDQMKHEGYMLTRFAPQGLGWIQHGAVHVFFPLLGAKPFVWLLGGEWVALLFNPAALALGAALLGFLARRKWGSVGGLLIAGSFLLSSYAGKILMYDMHPEALYPLLLFLWGAGMGLAARPAQMPGWAVAIGALGGMTLKEDAAFLFVPLFIHWVINSRGPQQRSAIVSLVIGSAAYLFQLFVLKSFATGVIGPQEWFGQPVMIPQSPISQAGSLLERMGGPMAWAGATLKFFASRPFLTLLVTTPWVVASPSFWSASAMLGALYVALGDPSKLWNYYSAPFLALFWFVAATLFPGGARLGRIRKETWLAWTVAASCLTGSGDVSWNFPSEGSRAIEAQARKLGECIVSDTGKNGGFGVIAPPLLGAVGSDARARAWTDRAPREPSDWDRTRFVLIAPKLPRWELGSEAISDLGAKLEKDPAWQRVGIDCKIASKDSAADPVVLFVKNAR